MTVDVAAARQLAENATAGPWTIEATGGRDYTGEGWYQVEINFADPVEPGAGLMLGDHENADADAAFIAAARTLVPALCDELVRVSGELANTQAALAAAMGELRDLAENGIRADLNPTVDRSNAVLVPRGYLERIDKAMRVRASATLVAASSLRAVAALRREDKP